MGKLKKLHPLAYAISTLDQTIKELKLRRAELVAQLPKSSKPVGLSYLYNPSTGRKENWPMTDASYVAKGVRSDSNTN